MEEEVFFNLNDLNIKQESLDIADTQEQEKPKEQEPEVEVQELNQEEPSVDISENPQDKADEKTETHEDVKTPSSEDSSHSNTLYTLAKHLKEEGVLYLDEDLEKVETLEDLKALIQKSNEQAKFAGLNESQRRYQEALQSGIPVKDYEQVERQIRTFEGINEKDIETNDNLRYEINVLDLMEKGVPQDKALKLGKLSLQDENNIADAKESLKNLIEAKKAQFKELVEAATKKTEVDLGRIKDAVFDKKELLEMPLNDITKNKLFDLITTKVETSEDGTPLNKLQKWQKENPVESQILLNYLFMITNEGKDLGIIKKTTSSTSAKELERKLKSMSFDENGSLIIPDSMIRGEKSDKGVISTKGLTINI